jgi:mannose-1-phosphate guanylyltransferase
MNKRTELNNSHLYAVIMAGGVGSRFWPRSREKTPKQLLEIGQKGTLIQNTVQRIEPLIPTDQTYIVTNKLQRSKVLKQLPGVPEENILMEPFGRNTAPCIGLAAMHILKRDPEAVMIVLPSDHLIKDETEFLRVLHLASEAANEPGWLVTIGIKPDRPETGFGYIQFNDEPDPKNPFFSRGLFRVRAFAEKPNLETAVQFLESGDFVWNSGMFIWRADTILRELKKHMPEMIDELSKIDRAIGAKEYDHVLETVYHVIRGQSIDYGVMEKAEHVFVIKGDFGWSDVGSWDEVYRISGKDDEGNSITGRVFHQDTTGSIIHAGDKFVATVGVEDLIVIVTDDAVLVCKKGRSQEVKEVVDYLRRKQHNELL